jgi:ribonuclease HI
MALIYLKEKEHESLKLAPDSQDLMESATKKWTRIVTDVSNAEFSAHYRGPIACKDKWQTLFADYKKISDYKAAIGSTEDYFHMASK